MRAVLGLLEEWIGPKGHRFLPLIGTLGIFILLGNYMGLVPGLDGADQQHQRHARVRADDLGLLPLPGHPRAGHRQVHRSTSRLPPGAPWWMAPLMFSIEMISHTSRVMSLSLRLFGNIFGEELVILILVSIVPFIVPLPMMILGLITGGLQAFIFVLLSIIYLQGAVAVEHEHDEHGHDAPHGNHAPAAA